MYYSVAFLFCWTYVSNVPKGQVRSAASTAAATLCTCVCRTRHDCTHNPITLHRPRVGRGSKGVPSSVCHRLGRQPSDQAGTSGTVSGRAHVLSPASYPSVVASNLTVVVTASASGRAVIRTPCLRLLSNVQCSCSGACCRPLTSKSSTLQRKPVGSRATALSADGCQVSPPVPVSVQASTSSCPDLVVCRCFLCRRRLWRCSQSRPRRRHSCGSWASASALLPPSLRLSF